MPFHMYLDNINRIKSFYDSDFYHVLSINNPEYVSKVIEALYDDPDADDKILYQLLGRKYGLPAKSHYLIDNVDNHSIKLSADIICGWHQLRQIHPDHNQWLSDYKLVRQNLNLHFIWPKHKLPTINTLRYAKYHDRIDLTLFDLKQFFAKKITPLSAAYNNPETSLWLKKFHSSFKQFIDFMQLHDFVDTNYNVLNIETRQQTIITTIPSRKIINSSIPKYTESLIALIKENKLGDK